MPTESSSCLELAAAVYQQGWAPSRSSRGDQMPLWGMRMCRDWERRRAPVLQGMSGPLFLGPGEVIPAV